MNSNLESIFQRAVCAIVMTLSLPFLVSGQQQNRLIDWLPAKIKSAAGVLEIVDTKVAGKSIVIGQPFSANEDWLDTLTFTIRNISGKTIKLLGFGVAFPELGADRRSLGFSIVYGVDLPGRASVLQKLVKPFEEVDLNLPNDQLEIMRKASVNYIGTSNLSKLLIMLGLVTFEDGSRSGPFSLRIQIHEKP